MFSIPIAVSSHAVARWRERAARYADADFEDILREVRACRLVPKGEPLPFPRYQHSVYLLHPSGVYFVAATLPGEWLVVTVISGGNGGWRWGPPAKKSRRRRTTPCSRFSGERQCG